MNRVVMNMGKEVKVLPTTVRVQNIDLLDFLKDLREILNSIDAGLGEVRASGLSITTSKGTISFSYAARDSFNILCSDPETLDKLIEAIKKYYESR